ncbi:MAG: hypothetical protein J6L20_03810 [Bacteroidales bacterium]|nr:hypothetical protein [Bacteroidales bacterium]
MRKFLTFLVLPAIIVVLGVLIWNSIQEPVVFKQERENREKVAIQRLKDIRTLQSAFKSSFGKFTPSMDTLIDFYNNGKITIKKQIGSMDDSVAVANTQALRKKNRKITNEELLAHYEKGMNLVLSIDVEIPVKDTLLKRDDFKVDDLRYIPFSDGKEVDMKATVKVVSGVDVPLFEAGMPFSDLLKGLNHQLIVNLNAERNDTGRYPGLKVGSIDAPNNNAGNWE